jgi:hypothetical protein
MGSRAFDKIALTARHVGLGSIATGWRKLQVLPRPQCPVSDGRPEKGGRSLSAISDQTACLPKSAEKLPALTRSPHQQLRETQATELVQALGQSEG